METILVTSEQRFANQYLHLAIFKITTILSIIGCVIIIGSFMLYRDIRTPSRHIIVCLSISDLTVALANFYISWADPSSIVDNDITCKIQGFIATTGMLWSFMWTMALAIFLNVLIVQKNPRLADSLLHPYFHVVCWLIPLCINVVALCLEKLGNPHDYVSSGWCWIAVDVIRNGTNLKVTNKNEAVFWMTIDGKLIELITYFVVFGLFMRIKFYLRRKLRMFERKEKDASTPESFTTSKTFKAAKYTDRKLISIPVVLILLRIWGTIRFFTFVASVNECYERLPLSEKVLMLFQAFGDNIIGAVNCVLFCFLTPKVWNHMKVSWKILTRCCCRPSQRPMPTEQTRLLSEKV